MTSEYALENSEEDYRSVLIHKKENLLFVGTDKGCIELWDLDKKTKLTELRYLVVDDYGEQTPVDDTVTEIIPNNDATIVYGFMGNAAYCIDVELKVIIQQIPVSEYILSGDVSHIDEKVATITDVGYLSVWGPKFYERIDSYEFQENFEEATLIYHDDLIIIINKKQVIVYRREDEGHYIARMNIDEFKTDVIKLLKPKKIDMNENYIIEINEGKVKVSKINIDNSKLDLTRELLVKELDAKNLEFTYYEDIRLKRRGKDRYRAELENANVFTTANKRDDNKTLNYAFDAFNSTIIREKSESKELIEKIAKRHNIPSIYIHRSHEYQPTNQNIIDVSRQMYFQTYKRENSIKRIMGIVIFFILLLLSTTMNYYSFTVFNSSLISSFLIILLIIKWNGINQKPKYPWVNDYQLIRSICLIAVILIELRVIILYTKLRIYFPFLQP